MRKNKGKKYAFGVMAAWCLAVGAAALTGCGTKEVNNKITVESSVEETAAETIEIETEAPQTEAPETEAPDPDEQEPSEPENTNQISANLADQLGGLINLAQEEGDTEMVSWLMERRHRLRTAAQNVGGMEQTADAARSTDRSQFASDNPEIFSEPQRPKRKRRFEL